MTRHPALLLTLFCTLALAAPFPALADARPPPLPAQSAGFQGFRALFHTPPAALPALAPPRAPAASRPARPALAATQGNIAPGGNCRAAISAAEARHGIPAGLLQAIGLVESGRPGPDGGARQPWPWAVNAEGSGMFFGTGAEAIAWVRRAEAGGMRSIDIGCMQVNRAFHPDAFASLEQGFDPAANADYAARFLRQLHAGPAKGDWMTAAGFYHSQTPARAEAYRAKVQAALGGGTPAGQASAGQASAGRALAGPPPATPGGGGQRLDNGSTQAALVPAAPGLTGRGLDAYRRNPVPLALVVPGLRVATKAGAPPARFLVPRRAPSLPAAP